MIANALAKGFYTVPEAARLIEVGNARRIYGWLRGYRDRKAGPLLHRDYDPIEGVQELSFLDLIEVRFVEHFREHGVDARTLRVAAENARAMLNEQHPFASERLKFQTDKKHIYLDEILTASARETGDRRLLNLITKQYTIYEAIARTLIGGVEFDPKTHLAGRWLPRPEKFPRIVVDPRIAYGRPAGPRGVPTATIYDAWKAEGENYDAAAWWLEIPTADVHEAVAFEADLAA